MIFHGIFQMIIPHFHILLVLYHNDGFASINKPFTFLLKFHSY